MKLFNIAILCFLLFYGCSNDNHSNINSAKLNEIDIKWSKNKSLCIVLCSKGYPDNFTKNVEIENLSKIKLNKNEFLFHAGTVNKQDKTYATGGRVLNFVSLSENFSNSRKNILNNLEKLNWSDGFYRKDIGYKVIK